jgi:DNA-binding NtrC family response regulator
LDENPGAICLDINMSEGLDILKRLKLANRDIPILVVTNNDAVDSAVEAMKIGAFDYMAKLEVANGGTLFLDELAEMPPRMQVKLLRFLQDKNFERVGGNKKIHVDLRIISATNRNLEEAVRLGNFREDLYYRLVVYSVFIPPLRERREDIPILINHFLKKYKSDITKKITTVSSYALEALVRYTWPGNVRQLENEIYRTMVSTRTDTVQIENLSPQIQKFREGSVDKYNQFIPAQENPERPLTPAPVSHLPTPSISSSGSKFDEIEKQAFLEALNRENGKIPQAAKDLGISRATFYRKIKKYRSAN